MPQICDPPLRRLAVPELPTHALHLALDRLAPAVENVRVEVTLERDEGADGPARIDRVDTPVDADHVVAGVLGELRQEGVGALGEERHGHGGDVLRFELRAHGGGDVLEGRERELAEVVRCQLARPRVEDLDELHMKASEASARVEIGRLR